MNRRATTALGTVAVVAVALTLAGCGQDGVSLARQACAHVDASFRLYREAQDSTGTQASNDLQKANNQLEAAEPLAAQATSDNGQWNALMTTLQEIGRVDERYLIKAYGNSVKWHRATSRSSRRPRRPSRPSHVEPPRAPRTPEAPPGVVPRRCPPRRRPRCIPRTSRARPQAPLLARGLWRANDAGVGDATLPQSVGEPRCTVGFGHGLLPAAEDVFELLTSLDVADDHDGHPRHRSPVPDRGVDASEWPFPGRCYWFTHHVELTGIFDPVELVADALRIVPFGSELDLSRLAAALVGVVELGDVHGSTVLPWTGGRTRGSWRSQHLGHVRISPPANRPAEYGMAHHQPQSSCT